MHPLLFTFPDFLPLIGGRGIHIYGVMIAMGFLLGMQWSRYESKRVGVDEKKVIDLFFYTIIAGLVGSRILYIVNSVDRFWSDPLILFRVWEGGLVFQGGIIGSLIVIFWLCRRYQLSLRKVADIFAPALSFGHGLGRVGCFFAGCCFGKQCDPHFFLAVIFPHIPNGIAPAGVPLYPTQLIEAFGELLILIVLIVYRKRKAFDGGVALLYLILYSILRSLNELLRGDVIRGFVVEPYLSVAQFISLVTIAVCVFLWIVLRKKSRI